MIYSHTNVHIQSSFEDTSSESSWSDEDLSGSWSDEDSMDEPWGDGYPSYNEMKHTNEQWTDEEVISYWCGRPLYGWLDKYESIEYMLAGLTTKSTTTTV